jgi:hypothetical protein
MRILLFFDLTLVDGVLKLDFRFSYPAPAGMPLSEGINATAKMP